MSEIILSSYPEKPNKTTAQLAAQQWLKTLDKSSTLMAWDKEAKASSLAVKVSDIDLTNAAVEYPVIFAEDNSTFTSTVILSEKEDLFLVDQKINTLEPSDFMANNGGQSGQDNDNYPEFNLDNVIPLAQAVDAGDAHVNLTDYMFGKEVGNEPDDGQPTYLLLLFKELSTYNINTIMEAAFGDYLPRAVTGKLKEKGVDGLLNGEPEIMESAYVGTITIDDPVIPKLKTINLVSLLLIADGMREPT